MASNSKVAALVVTYNRKELLKECLAAVTAQTYRAETIVVIDNASTDGTDELFAANGELGGIPGLSYRRMDANLGGAGGFKEGIRECMELGCDWVWLMDDDCIAQPDTLRALISASEASLAFGDRPSFLASSVYGPAGEVMNVPLLDTRSTANGYADWYRPLASGMVEIECATFVSLLISANAIEKVGLPIADFFIWGDDTEYTTRLTHYFGPAYLVGASQVVHKRSNAKSIDVRNEEDPARIANYWRLYRNGLIVQRCHHGKGRAAKRAVSYLCTAVKCALFGSGGAKIRLLRAHAIFKGLRRFVFAQYELEDLERLQRGL